MGILLWLGWRPGRRGGGLGGRVKATVLKASWDCCLKEAARALCLVQLSRGQIGWPGAVTLGDDANG